jgi:hypothetical protein
MIIAQPTAMEASAINSLSKSNDWVAVSDYFRRALRELDVQLRACGPERLGKLQGAAIVIDELLKLPDVSQQILAAKRT